VLIPDTDVINPDPYSQGFGLDRRMSVLPSYNTLKPRVRRWGYSDEATRVTGQLKLRNMNFFN
jgi:hypothetical protein